MKKLFIFFIVMTGALSVKSQQKVYPILKEYTLLLSKILIDGKAISSGDITLNASTGEAFVQNERLLKATITYSLDTLKDNAGNLTTVVGAKSYFHKLSDNLKDSKITVDFLNTGNDNLEVSININGTIKKFSTWYRFATLSDRWAVVVEPINLILDYKKNQQDSIEKMKLYFYIIILK